MRIAEPAGGRGGAREGLAPAGDVTRAHARLAERLEDVGVAGVVGAQDVAQVGRAVEQPRALGVVEAAHGVVAGVQRVAQGLLRGDVRHGLEHVERELGEVLVGALAVALAQRTGDVGVQRAALAGREGGEQRLAHERVGEVEAARSRLAGDEPRAGGLVDRRERRAQLDVGGRRQRAEPELAADDGADGQDPRRLRPQRRDAAPDRLGDALRQRQRAARGDLLAVGEDEPQQLVGEERVAGADVVHGAHEIGLRVGAGVMGDQLARRRPRSRPRSGMDRARSRCSPPSTAERSAWRRASSSR